MTSRSDARLSPTPASILEATGERVLLAPRRGSGPDA